MAASKDSLFGEQAGTVELLWGPRPQPTRGPKPTLSVERIARAAIEVADAEGLAAVSMQRVAGTLNFTKMSLYRHVPGKAELIALMTDTAIGEPPEPAAVEGGWRARLQEWAYRLLAMFQRHPWLLAATVGPRIMGPNEMGWMERAIAALDGTGLDGGERMDAVVVISGHIRTIAQQAGGTPDPEAQMVAPIVALMRVHGERYPAVTAALASAVAHDSRDKGLDFGLQRILDGLGLFIGERSGTHEGAGHG